MILPGSYANGFAPRDGSPLYPELWRGCVLSLNATLGPSGKTAIDWSPQKNNAAFVNDTVFGLAGGKYGFKLDGIDDYLQPAKSINRLTAQSTIATIVYPTGLTIGKLGGIVKSTTNSPVAGDFILYVNNTTFGLATWGTTAKRTESAVALANNNLWALSATYNAATDAVRLFINGAEVSTTTGSSFGGGWLTEYSVGRAYPGTAYCWAGSIMQVDLYDRILSDSTIKTHSARPGIAYEMAPRRRSRAAVITSGFSALRPSILRGSR
jgi:hypothetical protein